MNHSNDYEDGVRAESYARLEFPGTYYLAYRDLAEIYLEHAKGKKALDFGCGAGRSTRFLKQQGFDVIGVDISRDMILQARGLDPAGDYRLIENKALAVPETYDLVTSIFTFDNIADIEKRVSILLELKAALNDHGRLILLDSTPEMYFHEWSSFSTRDFPENRDAQSGEIVRIITTDVADKRPVEDILWLDADYRAIFEQAGLKIVRTYKPLARASEPFAWVNETEIAPWVIYVLKICNE